MAGGAGSSCSTQPGASGHLFSRLPLPCSSPGRPSSLPALLVFSLPPSLSLRSLCFVPANRRHLPGPPASIVYTLFLLGFRWWELSSSSLCAPEGQYLGRGTYMWLFSWLPAWGHVAPGCGGGGMTFQPPWSGTVGEMVLSWPPLPARRADSGGNAP